MSEARQSLEEGITIWREIGDHASMAQSLNNLGDVLLEMKNFSEARSNFIEALSVARKTGLLPIMLDSLLGESILRIHSDEKKFASEALSHIMNHPASTQITKKRAEKIYADLSKEGVKMDHDSLHEDAFNRLLDEMLGKGASYQTFA